MSTKITRALEPQPLAAGQQRTLRNIVTEIRTDLQATAGADWKRKHYAAVPYLEALDRCESVNDTYGHERAGDLVRYLLGNLTTWRGETARRVKLELKGLLK